MSKVQAEGVDEALRYDSFTMDGLIYRLDKKTGNLEKLQKLESGLTWVKVEVQVSNSSPIGPKTSPVSSHTSSNELGQMNQPPKERNSCVAPFQLFDEQDNDITDAITDADRKSALAAIAVYEGKLSISHTVKMSDKITGNILLKNLGDKRLRALELTMQVPVIGRDKPEEHRFLFLDKPGMVNPPQPGSGVKEASALLQKVDIQSPAGGIKGTPELKVTYIKFAD